jgi:hypothetical protein
MQGSGGGRHDLSKVLAAEFTAVKGDRPDAHGESLAAVMDAAAQQVEAVNLAPLEKTRLPSAPDCVPPMIGPTSKSSARCACRAAVSAARRFRSV